MRRADEGGPCVLPGRSQKRYWTIPTADEYGDGDDGAHYCASGDKEVEEGREKLAASSRGHA